VRLPARRCAGAPYDDIVPQGSWLRDRAPGPPRATSAPPHVRPQLARFERTLLNQGGTYERSWPLHVPVTIMR